MDTGQALTERLRLELNCPSLVAQVFHDRWCVFEVTRELTPGRDVPFRLSDQGEVLDGEATVREVCQRMNLVYVHETRHGEYAPAEPLPILAALHKQDRWAGPDPVRRILAWDRDRKERNRRESSQLFHDLAGEHRRLFAKAADELGV